MNCVPGDVVMGCCGELDCGSVAAIFVSSRSDESSAEFGGRFVAGSAGVEKGNGRSSPGCIPRTTMFVTPTSSVVLVRLTDDSRRATSALSAARGLGDSTASLGLSSI